MILQQWLSSNRHYFIIECKRRSNICFKQAFYYEPELILHKINFKLTSTQLIELKDFSRAGFNLTSFIPINTCRYYSIDTTHL
jgi:hypothetical protein